MINRIFNNLKLIHQDIYSTFVLYFLLLIISLSTYCILFLYDKSQHVPDVVYYSVERENVDKICIPYDVNSNISFKDKLNNYLVIKKIEADESIKWQLDNNNILILKQMSYQPAQNIHVFFDNGKKLDVVFDSLNTMWYANQVNHENLIIFQQDIIFSNECINYKCASFGHYIKNYHGILKYSLAKDFTTMLLYVVVIVLLLGLYILRVMICSNHNNIPIFSENEIKLRCN